jgi:hypothetical protein
MPGPVGERDRGGASWCWAVWSRKRARALRLWSSEVRRARATARVWGTAGASHRSATPSRVAGSALVWPIAGRVDWRWVCGTGARRAARVRRRCGRRRRPARGARLSAGEPSAWGTMPPRRRVAIWGAARFAFFAWPPWRACLERAWPQTQGRPCAAPRAARPSQVQRHATAPPRPAREGATAWRNGAGAADLGRWSHRAPSWLTMQTDIRRAWKAIPQYKGCWLV